MQTPPDRCASVLHKVPPMSRQKVLLVEDSEINCMVAQQILEDLNYEVLCASNGCMALELLEDSSRHIDLILMDTKMPLMNGYDTVRMIRQMKGCEDIPIYSISASEEREERKKCLECGMNGFLKKPLTHENLAKELAAVPRRTQSLTVQESSPLAPADFCREELLRYSASLSQAKKVVGVFMKTMPPKYQRLLDACDEHNWEEITDLAHALKIAVIYVGSPSLQVLFGDLEKRAAGKDISACKSLIAAVGSAYKGFLEGYSSQIKEVDDAHFNC